MIDQKEFTNKDGDELQEYLRFDEDDAGVFEMIDQKEFCANKLCPHHLLSMNKEMHYHACDGGIYTNTGILYTKKYISKLETIIHRRFRRSKIIIKEQTNYFCEICFNAIQMTKEID